MYLRYGGYKVFSISNTMYLRNDWFQCNVTNAYY